MFKPNRVSCLVNLDTRAAAFSVWHSLYNRFDDGLLPKENLSETTMSAIAHVGVLESQITQMRVVSLGMLSIFQGIRN